MMNQEKIFVLHLSKYDIYQQILVIPHTDSDNGDRASLQNVGFWLNIDVADRPRGFYNIHVPWKC
jgi:hypothetical protein